MFIDTHCHLTDSAFSSDLSSVLTNAKKAGVKQFIVPGTDAYSSSEAIRLGQRYPGVIFPAVGYHPYEAENAPDVRSLTSCITTEVVAIGECGLDYHVFGDEPAMGKKDRQRELFDMHCKIALHYDLPLIIHVRSAFDDCLDILDSQPSMPRGVIHCFSGGTHHINEFHKRGFYMGIDGNCTYSKHIQSILPTIPQTALLLETDAPLLTPIPHRGERNEPKHLIHTAKCIAVRLGCSIDELASQTSANARALFHI